ncbi:MAG: hypothetical protein PWQ97_502 [Tepidanaerobacteraceae bacterium]|nr:hypothetical protein [Tepidanaerobacteraceae bacterium]
MAHEIKRGIFSWFGFVLPLPERLRLIKGAGFNATSIWWEDEQEPFVIHKQDMPEMVKKAGLVLENIHVPYNNSNDLWSEKKQDREDVVRKHIEWLHDCSRFDIPLMVMHIIEGGEPPAPNEYGLKSMTRIVEAAEHFKVKIAIENTHRDDSVIFLLSRIKSSYMGFCYDSSHAMLRKHRNEILLKDYGCRLFATHLSDNDGCFDRHWLPGNGKINWEGLGALFPEDYKGFFTLETVPSEEEKKLGPEKFLAKAFEKISWVEALFTASRWTENKGN